MCLLRLRETVSLVVKPTSLSQCCPISSALVIVTSNPFFSYLLWSIKRRTPRSAKNWMVWYLLRKVITIYIFCIIEKKLPKFLSFRFLALCFCIGRSCPVRQPLKMHVNGMIKQKASKQKLRWNVAARNSSESHFCGYLDKAVRAPGRFQLMRVELAIEQVEFYRAKDADRVRHLAAFQARVQRCEPGHRTTRTANALRTLLTFSWIKKFMKNFYSSLSFKFCVLEFPKCTLSFHFMKFWNFCSFKFPLWQYSRLSPCTLSWHDCK